MKKIFLIVLVIALFPMYCFGNKVDNSSFKMLIDAISLNNQTTKDFYIVDIMTQYIGTPKLIAKKHDSHHEYFSEVTSILEKELKSQDYKKNEDYTATNRIDLYYSLLMGDVTWLKHVTIESKNNYTNEPLWHIALFVNDNNSQLRFYIPSMIKCAAPYFNKNFKGIVTCKR